MKAVIMAGGEGTRLRPLTCNCPKPMVPIVNKPVIEHIIELLKKHNLNDIAITLQYMPEVIKDYFGDGKEYGVNIRYYIEQVPLGTAGSVKNAEEFLDDSFVVISGDAVTDVNLERVIEFHNNKNSMATLVLKKVDIPLDYGIVVTADDGRIVRFLEKPSWGEVFSDTVNTGIYVFSPVILSFFNKNEMFDFSKDLFPMLLREKIQMYGFITEDYWCDIGDLRAYAQSHIDIMDGKVNIKISGKQISDNIWVDDDVDIDNSVTLTPPCIIGKNTKIRAGVSIGSYSVIGENNFIGERSSIKRTIIWKNCLIDRNVQLRGSVICSKVHLRDNSSTFEHTVVGDETVIRENAVVKPNIKIWPGKIIDEGTEVNSNLVWGSKFTKSIFGNRGIAGEINVDITPEYASKLGAAYGAMFKGKGRVGISCDDSTAAKMLKISLVSGLLSAGIEVFDFGKMLLPVTRSAIRFYKTDGGIHISTSTEDGSRLFVDFLDRNGGNIDRGTERKIENIFIREDFSRCKGNSIKDIQIVTNYSDFYLKNIINSVKSSKLPYKIALNSRSRFISKTMSELLEELGCNVEIMNLRLMNTKTMTQSMTSNDVRFFTSNIKLNNFDLGVSIEDTSEKMMLVDHNGRIITEDMFFALVSIIFLKVIKGGTIVVPVSASQAVERIAKANNGKVVRTKTSPQDFMSKIFEIGMEDEMLEQFTMHFDAMAGLVKILDFMNLNNYRLSDLVDMIPKFHMYKKEVKCSWNVRGKVIREIMEESRNGDVETVDGVKIYDDNGWVLVIPDADKPVFRIISESSSAEFAEELVNIYAEKVRRIIKS